MSVKKIAIVCAIIFLVTGGLGMASCTYLAKQFADSDYSGYQYDPEAHNLYWPSSYGLGAKLPSPDSEKGDITEDSDSKFFVTVMEVTPEQYAEYVAACAKKGYTISAVQGENTYTAACKDERSLYVGYDPDKQEMTVRLVVLLHEVKLKVTCIENWMFSKYDLMINMDYNYQGQLEHGSSKTYIDWLPAGTHTIRAEKYDNYEVDGTADFELPDANVDMTKYATAAAPDASDDATHLKVTHKVYATVYCTSDQAKVTLVDKDGEELDDIEILGTGDDVDTATAETKSAASDASASSSSSAGASTSAAASSEKKTADAVDAAAAKADDSSSGRYTAVNAKDLVSAMKKDSAAASKKYLNRKVELKGEVCEVASDGGYVALVPKGQKEEVLIVCSAMDSDIIAQVKKLKAGSQVTIQGEVLLVDDTLGYGISIDKVK